MNVRVLSLLIGIVIAQALTGCDGKQPSATDGVKIDPPKQRFVIVCTTMINTEMAQLLAGDLTNPQVEIRGLMQRGDDPHSYVIRPADLQSLREADLVLMNGLELEATLESLIDEHAKDAVIVRLGEATGVNHISGEGGKPDPHVWMSPANYGAMLDRAADALARVVTRHGAAIRKRAAAHQSQVTELHKWVQEKAAALPADRRTLLASDDGLTYLGNLLGVKIVHLAIDPDAQPTQADRDALFALVDRGGAAAVFIDRGDSSIWHDVVADLGGTRKITVGPALRSHDLAEEREMGETYLGLIRANVESIVQVLAMETVQPN